MRKILFSVLGLVSCVGVSAWDIPDDDNCSGCPEVTIPEFSGIGRIPDVAQYKFGDWSGLVGMVCGIPLSEALWIMSQNSEITFFFYTKGEQMVLETPEGGTRVFRHGDAVFFKGEPQWGEAKGLADGFVKTN